MVDKVQLRLVCGDGCWGRHFGGRHLLLFAVSDERCHWSQFCPSRQFLVFMVACLIVPTEMVGKYCAIQYGRRVGNTDEVCSRGRLLWPANVGVGWGLAADLVVYICIFAIETKSMLSTVWRSESYTHPKMTIKSE